ncbi:hypothetical protein WR25_12444 [Diploscapter pachys]|uniref:Uncharacterized protein n=1 Tax=Diploscapter pachys TaxID=2018661 RepID=A0A2A2JXD4_9BILA|nr:hypothetical protein WR25_12444 [Diploscapter pachys]
MDRQRDQMERADIQRPIAVRAQRHPQQAEQDRDVDREQDRLDLMIGARRIEVRHRERGQSPRDEQDRRPSFGCAASEQRVTACRQQDQIEDEDVCHGLTCQRSSSTVKP